MANWYYARANQQIGPLELYVLQGMLQRGEVLAGELVWTDGMSEWTPAGQVAALRTIAPPSMMAPAFAPHMPQAVGPGVPMSPPLGYQHPYSAYGSAAEGLADHSGKATASMVLGIVSLLAWFCPLVGFGVTITGLVMGSKGKQSSARGQAVAGLVLNTIGLILTIINAAW